jgi:hypothetical protein
MAFTDGSTVAFTVGGTTYRYNLSSAQASAGIWTVQNVTPTFQQAKAGAVSDNDVQPFAEESFSDWTGSIGLYESTDDPGDLTRPFFSTLDTSKPRQLTGPPYLKSGAAAINTNAIDTAGTIYQWVNSNSGPGFVAKKNGSAVYGYWRWNETTFSWDYQRDLNGTPATAGDFAGASRAVTGSMHKPFCTVSNYGSALWMCNGTGLTNIAIAAAAPAGAGIIANLVGTAKFFDQLVTFAVNNGNIDVVCYNDSAGDATLTRTLSIGADGSTSNNIKKIYGETVLMGAVALNGTLFVFTDKSLYALQWIEATNVFVVEPIIENTAKFTSNPAVFQNELYCGSDNQLWHWTPGQGNADFKQVDATGWMPSPFNGRVTELHPFMQTMAVKVVDFGGASTFSPEKAVLLRYTALGAWQYLADAGGYAHTISAVVAPCIKTQDGTNFPGIHFPISGSFTGCFAVFEGGLNVRTQTSGTLATGSGAHVTPWRYGTNRTSQKQLLRERFEVENADIAGTTSMQFWYQTNLDNRLTPPTVLSGYNLDTTNLGQWKAASPAMKGGTTGDASSVLDSTGTGVLWCEHDGTNGADWHGSTAYPSYRRIRYLYTLYGGTGANGTCALISHSYQYLEYAFKFYVINCTLHLEINMDHPTNPGSAITSPTLLMAEVNRIQGWDYGKNIITVVGPDNVSYPSVITKYLANVTKIDPNGVWSVDVALTLQCVKMFGLAI